MARVLKLSHGGTKSINIHMRYVKSYPLSVLSTGREFLGFSPSEPVTVVLEDDGTIVEDQSYFLCLPLNTKFMLLHEKETWSPVRRSKSFSLRFVYSDTALCFGTNLLFIAVDGGTAWMARDSMLLEADSVDAACAAAPWWDLSQQLKHDLASIILMSEADLQVPILFLYFTDSVRCHTYTNHDEEVILLSSVVTVTALSCYWMLSVGTYRVEFACQKHVMEIIERETIIGFGCT